MHEPEEQVITLEEFKAICILKGWEWKTNAKYALYITFDLLDDDIVIECEHGKEVRAYPDYDTLIDYDFMQGVVDLTPKVLELLLAQIDKYGATPIFNYMSKSKHTLPHRRPYE